MLCNGSAVITTPHSQARSILRPKCGPGCGNEVSWPFVHVLRFCAFTSTFILYQNSILSASMSHNIDLEAQAEQQVLAVLEEGVERSKIYGGSTSIPLCETKSASGAKPVATDQQVEVKASPATSQTAGVALYLPLSTYN